MMSIDVADLNAREAWVREARRVAMLETQAALGLIEDVLDHTRLEGGQLKLTVSGTDVAAIATRVVHAHRAAALTKGLRLLTILPSDTPSIELDAARFEQVLHHLLDNAIKFTIRGAVSVTLVTDAVRRRPARLLVADTGIGIPGDRLEKIFEPVVQVDGGNGRPHGGAGLGLPLARQLCNAMGCTLTVDSSLGQGSRFTVKFPPTPS